MKRRKVYPLCNVNCGLGYEKPTWRKFVKVCRANGTTAAAVLRDFIHDVLAEAKDYKLCKM